MGTIKQGILGGFSGKVGTVVGSSWKGISYMRGRAQSVRNPRTEGQMEQCSKFAQVLELLKPITAYVRIGFKTYAKQQTAFNVVMAYNVKNAFSGTCCVKLFVEKDETKKTIKNYLIVFFCDLRCFFYLFCNCF